MQYFLEMAAILGVTIASLQLGLVLSWGLLSLILDSMQAVRIQETHEQNGVSASCDSDPTELVAGK